MRSLATICTDCLGEFGVDLTRTNIDKHRENEKAFNRGIQNKRYISLGTTKTKAQCSLDFIGFSVEFFQFMYELRKQISLFMASALFFALPRPSIFLKISTSLMFGYCTKAT